jgi:hypothetical protein
MCVRSAHRSPPLQNRAPRVDFQTLAATASLLQVGCSKEVKNHTLVGFSDLDESYLLGTVN